MHKGNGIRSAVGVTSLLSILGSFLIIFSYLLFKDIRTRARLILFHLSVADLGVGVANFVGDVVKFERYYFNSVNGTLLPSPPAAAVFFCKTQAFLALFFTISSILWTCILAVYMYFLIVEKTDFFMKYYVLGSYVFCYGLPLLICIWLITTNRLGYSPYNASGWCSLIVKRVQSNSMGVSIDSEERFVNTDDIYVAIFAYDLWIVTTIVLTVVVYVSTFYFIRQEVRYLITFILQKLSPILLYITAVTTKNITKKWSIYVESGIQILTNSNTVYSSSDMVPHQ